MKYFLGCVLGWVLEVFMLIVLGGVLSLGCVLGAFMLIVLRGVLSLGCVLEVFMLIVLCFKILRFLKIVGCFLGYVLGDVLCMGAFMLIVLCFEILRFLKNVIRFLYEHCFSATATGQDSQSLGPHYFSTLPSNVWFLVHDLLNFEISSQVPEGLSYYIASSKKVQAEWYRKLLKAWKEATPPPKTTEEAVRLAIQTLKANVQQADVERLLAFYALPLPHTLNQFSLPKGVQFEQRTFPVDAKAIEDYGNRKTVSAEIPTSLPDGVEFELHTLPVDAKAVGDGDGMTVYVGTTYPRELESIPTAVLQLAGQRSKALARKDYTKADELHQKIIDSGYGVIDNQNEEILAREYRIRLRGIDAPELPMPYGKEAKEELVKLVQGKCLRMLAYEEDIYGRTVADVYCDGMFVQEALLKKGCAWHFKFHDQRPEFAKWEKKARRKRVGLWASPNPEEPWEWRRRKPKKKEMKAGAEQHRIQQSNVRRLISNDFLTKQVLKYSVEETEEEISGNL